MVGRMDIARCCCGSCTVIETESDATATVDANATFSLTGGKWTLTRTASGAINALLLFTPTISSSGAFYFLARVVITHSTGRPNFRVQMLTGADNTGAGGMEYERFVESAYHGATFGTSANYETSADCEDLLDSSYPTTGTSATLTMFVRHDGSIAIATNTTTEANALDQVGTGFVDRSPSFSGNCFGFRISDLSNSVSKIEIDQITGGPLTSGGNACKLMRTNCCDGPVPDSGTLEISGLPNDSSFQVLVTTYSGIYTYVWKAKLDLSQFDGTHIVENWPFVKDSEGEVWWSYCRTDEQCVWGIWLDATTDTLIRYPSFGFPLGQPATASAIDVKVLLKVTLYRYLDGSVDHWVQLFCYDENGTELGQRHYYVDPGTYAEVLETIKYGRITSELSTTDDPPCVDGVAESTTEYEMTKNPGTLIESDIWTDLTGSWSV